MEKTAITPRIALYDTTFRVLEVPARLKPSAIRCLTDSVTDVLPTASTWGEIYVSYAVTENRDLPS